MANTTFKNYKTEIEEAAQSAAMLSGRDDVNVEDRIRTANDLLRGLRILQENEKASKLENEQNEFISSFANTSVPLRDC